MGGKCFNNCSLLSPGQVRKFPFLIEFRNILGVGLKQNQFRYWISSIYVLSLVIIAWTICLNCLDMGMYYNPSDLFLCTLNVSLESLRILISLLYKMLM